MKKIILLSVVVFNLVNAYAQCWRSVTAGNFNSFAIKNDGTLWAWGDNSTGELGDGTYINKIIPTQIGFSNDWKMVSAGGGDVSANYYPSDYGSTDGYTLAIKNNGTLWAWGVNYHGQLGIGYSDYGTYVNLPVQVGTDSNWRFVSAGSIHSLAIKSNGTLWAWGDNYFGELGNGTNGNTNVPVQINKDTNWLAVCAGSQGISHAIKIDGTLWAWGYNYGGELGDGTDSLRNIPTQIGTDTNWKAIDNTVALKKDGTLWAWGNHISVGTYQDTIVSGGSTIITTVDSFIPPPTKIGTDNNWQSLSGGLLTKTDGTVWGWGANHFGEIGDGTDTDRAAPVQITAIPKVQYISQGTYHSLVITTDGSLWSWGDNYSGQLGDSSLQNSNVPVQLPCRPSASVIFISFSGSKKGDSTLLKWQTSTEQNISEYQIERSTDEITFTNIGSLPSTHNITGDYYSFIDASPLNPGNNFYRLKRIDSSGVFDYSDTILVIFNIPPYALPTSCWRSVFGGYDHSLAIKKDGTLWAWGVNLYAVFGNATVNDSPIPVQTGSNTDPTFNIQSVSAGQAHTLAVKTDGTLWAWGHNESGELGNGTNYPLYLPAKIGTDTNWQSTAAGQAIIHTIPYNVHSLAVKKDGTLWAWGDDTYGELGDGTNTAENAPIQIGTATNWQSVAAGEDYSLAIKTDGTLWGWGYNNDGQLGDGTNTNKNIPTQIGTATNWKAVSAGWNHSAALKTDGTIWSWGDNTYGQLGDGTSTTKYFPVQVGTASNWQSVSVGWNHSIALKMDSTIWAWGQNNYGQLGDGTVTNNNIPIQIGVDTNWQSVSAGLLNSFAIKSDGELLSWGYNVDGELGNGTYSTQNTSLPTEIACYPTLVPIKLTSFTAQKQGAVALLNWQAATEINSKQYEIERSTDNIIFNTIGTVTSTNNATGSRYAYTDAQPYSGHNYYRLKCIDIDGNYIYSNINELTFGPAANQVNIYPDPVEDVLNVESNFKAEKLNIRITDVTGRKILETIKPNSHLLQIPTANLNAGVYLLNISDGANMFSKKIIKE